MAAFATTRWTLVQRAADASHPGAEEALAYLCSVYWPPIYVYFRRKGSSAADAADLTQDFFTRVLEKGYFDQARRERGTFRTFLLTCAKNFLANEWDRANAKKRGGGQALFSLDHQEIEHRYQVEPHHDVTPERIFEQQWAWSVVDHAVGRLEEDVRAAGREKLYAGCRDFLLGGSEAAPYRDVAKQLGISEGALKVQVHRLRKRLRELLLEEIEEAGAPADDAERELHHLLTLLLAPRE